MTTEKKKQASISSAPGGAMQSETKKAKKKKPKRSKSDGDAAGIAQAPGDGTPTTKPKKKKKKKSVTNLNADGTPASPNHNGDSPAAPKKKKKKKKSVVGESSAASTTTTNNNNNNNRRPPHMAGRGPPGRGFGPPQGRGRGRGPMPPGARGGPPPRGHSNTRPPPRRAPPPGYPGRGVQARSQPGPPLRNHSNGTISTARSAASSVQRSSRQRPAAPQHPDQSPSGSRVSKKTSMQKTLDNTSSHSSAVQPNGQPKESEQTTDDESWNPPSNLLILLWVVVGAELLMDLITTIISFKYFVETGSCCGEPIGKANLPIGLTVPFFLIVLVEIVLLAYSIRLSLYIRKRGTQLSRGGFMQDPANPDDKFLVLPDMHSQSGSKWMSFINVLVLLNPFFGSVIAWMLLYQSSEQESFTVLGLEAASLLLHWFSVYLEGRRLSWCSKAMHAVPIIPFFVTVICILVYLQEGGVCYLAEDSVFWYEGCQLCADGTLPVRESGVYVCADESSATQQTYCGLDKQFCFYPY